MIHIFSRFCCGFLLLSAALLTGCGGSPTAEGPPPASIEGGTPSTPASAANSGEFNFNTEAVSLQGEYGGLSRPVEKEIKNPVVLIKTNLGDITLELNLKEAPRTVNNFIDNYVDQGFYDQTLFHYVDKGYMIAAGGYSAQLEAGQPRTQIHNEATNGLKNKRGTIAMARLPDYIDSATCQFFINLADNPDLDYKSADSPEDYGYCVFGTVTSGLEVVDRIAEVEVQDANGFVNLPVNPVVIQTIQRIK